MMSRRVLTSLLVALTLVAGACSGDDRGTSPTTAPVSPSTTAGSTTTTTEPLAEVVLDAAR